MKHSASASIVINQLHRKMLFEGCEKVEKNIGRAEKTLDIIQTIPGQANTDDPVLARLDIGGTALLNYHVNSMEHREWESRYPKLVGH